MSAKQLGAVQHVGDGTLHFLRDITEDEDRRISASVEGLLRYQREEGLYRVTQLNLGALDQFIVDALVAFTEETQTSLLLGIPPKRVAELNLEANRHFLNVLTSFRMYLDHVETTLKRSFGATSPQARAFHDACAAEYDANLSYAFVYKLRNYTQHCGLPIAAVVLSGSREPLAPDQTDAQTAAFTNADGHRSVVLNLDRDALLGEFEWPRAVRAYISSLTRISRHAVKWGLPSAVSLQYIVSSFRKSRRTRCSMRPCWARSTRRCVGRSRTPLPSS